MSLNRSLKKKEHRLTVESTVQATILECTVEPRLSEPRLSESKFALVNEFIEFLVGIRNNLYSTSSYTLILVIRTIQLSKWLLEQRCSDNRGFIVP